MLEIRQKHSTFSMVAHPFSHFLTLLEFKLLYCYNVTMLHWENTMSGEKVAFSLYYIKYSSSFTGGSKNMKRHFHYGKTNKNPHSI